MSGHSKWSTIKRQKGANDAARGKLFSKLSKAISIAIKTGGGPNPDTNNKLRVAIDAAKAENMPKATIDRAISRASETGDMEEVTYEGFGPHGVQIMVEAATDNRNRTSQEVKTAFDRGGGSMGGPGAVAFNFTPKGLIIIKKTGNADEMMLELIDLGVEEIDDGDGDGELEAYVAANELYAKKQELESAGYEVLKTELIQKPTTLMDIDDAKSGSVFRALELLEDVDDVQKVFTNADFI